MFGIDIKRWRKSQLDCINSQVEYLGAKIQEERDKRRVLGRQLEGLLEFLNLEEVEQPHRIFRKREK